MREILLFYRESLGQNKVDISPLYRLLGFLVSFDAPEFTVYTKTMHTYIPHIYLILHTYSKLLYKLSLSCLLPFLFSFFLIQHINSLKFSKNYFLYQKKQNTHIHENNYYIYILSALSMIFF